MPTFDGDELTITLDAPTDGVLTISVGNDIYSEWKEWVLLSDNSKYPPAFRPDGGADLTPGIAQGSYFFLRNDFGWRIKPHESTHTVYVVENLVPEDSSLPIVVPTAGAFTVLVLGLQPITQKVDDLIEGQQIALYNGSVSIDTIDGVPGTSFPIGTSSRPVSNLADAHTIADSLGISAFIIRGSITLTQNCTNCEFTGFGADSEVDIDNYDVSGAVFQGLNVVGDFSNSISATPHFLKCRFGGMGAIDNIWGILDECSLSGNVTLGAGFIGMTKCTTTLSGGTAIEVDFQGNIMAAVIRNFTGSLLLRNMTSAASSATMDVTIGRVELAATCTNGVVTLNGFAILTDQSAGTTVNIGALIKVDLQNEQLLDIRKKTKMIPASL